MTLSISRHMMAITLCLVAFQTVPAGEDETLASKVELRLRMEGRTYEEINEDGKQRLKITREGPYFHLGNSGASPYVVSPIGIWTFQCPIWGILSSNFPEKLRPAPHNAIED